MNTLKKLNNYLLTHQPLIWQTRVIQISVVTALMNAVFYFVGYFNTNLTKIKFQYNIQDWFFQDMMVLYWIIAGLILLIIWGAYFYRYNAAKNFYPISRFYFHKMTLCLLIPIVMYFLVPFSYYSGTANRAESVVSKEAWQELNEVSKFAFPFLLSYNDDYYYTQRSFPEVYNGLNYWSNDDYNEYDYIPEYIYQGSKMRLNKILKKVEAKPLSDSLKLFAYKTEFVEVKTIIENDTCVNFESEFVRALTLDSLPDFQINHVKNYTPNLYEYSYSNSIIRGWGEDVLSYDESDYQEPLYDEKLNKYLSITHDWIDNKPHEIKKTLVKFKSLIDKYEIENSLDVEKNYNYLIENNFVFYEALTTSIARYDGYYDEEYMVYDDIEPYDDEDSSLFVETYKGEGFYHQNLDYESLNNLDSNMAYVYGHGFLHDMGLFWVLSYVMLFMLILMVYFQWGSVLSFVLSIPVSGIIALLGVLIFMLIRKPWNYDELYYQIRFPLENLIFVILGLLVLTVAIVGSKRVWNKYITNIAITISYLIAPLWINMLIFLIHGAFSKMVHVPCGGYLPEVVVPFSLNSPQIAIITQFSPFILFFISLFFIKMILSKKEG